MVPKLKIDGKAPTMAEIVVDLEIPMAHVKRMLELVHAIEAKQEYNKLAKEVQKLRQKRNKNKK